MADNTSLKLAIERLFSKEILERSPLLLAYISSKMSVPLAVVAQVCVVSRASRRPALKKCTKTHPSDVRRCFFCCCCQHLGFFDSAGDFGALTSAIQDSDVCVATPDRKSTRLNSSN